MTRIHDALVKVAQEKELFKERIASLKPQRHSFMQIPYEIENKMAGLYQSIYSLVPKKMGLSTLFISPGHSEDASVLLREFAKVSAFSLKKSVLLLNANAEFDHLTHFTVAPDQCWDDIIREKKPIEDAIYQVESTGLYVSQMSMQEKPVCTILDSQLSEKYLNYLENVFDLILIDMSPAVSSVGCGAFARRIDGVILVIEAGSTRWQSAAKLRENVELLGGKVLGVLLNKRHHYIPNYMYNFLFKK